MDDKIRSIFVASPKTIKMGIFTKIITPKDGEKLTECVTIPNEEDEED